MRRKSKDKIFCAKCNVEMQIKLIDNYEFEEGINSHNVSGYKCSKCNKVFFTEEQVKEGFMIRKV